MADDTLHLVRDLLDQLVVDRDGREMGRVDGVILGADRQDALRVIAIEIGAAVLFGRVRPWAGRWAAALERGLGIDRGRPIRVPFHAIVDVDRHIRLGISAGDTASPDFERRLRRIFSSIPGGS